LVVDVANACSSGAPRYSPDCFTSDFTRLIL
jgi:hypothetical protein